MFSSFFFFFFFTMMASHALVCTSLVVVLLLVVIDRKGADRVYRRHVVSYTWAGKTNLFKLAL